MEKKQIAIKFKEKNYMIKVNSTMKFEEFKEVCKSKLGLPKESDFRIYYEADSNDPKKKKEANTIDKLFHYASQPKTIGEIIETKPKTRGDQPQNNPEMPSSNNDQLDKFKIMINDQFTGLLQEIHDLNQVNNKNDKQLDLIIIQLKKELNQNYNQNQQGPINPSTMPSKYSKLSVQWDNNNDIYINNNQSKTKFIMTMINNGSCDWPNEIELSASNISTIVFKSEIMKIPIKPQDKVNKYIYFETENIKEGNYSCFMQLKNKQTKEIIGEQEIKLIYKQLSEQEKMTMIRKLKNEFPDLNETILRNKLEDTKYDYNSAFISLKPTLF